MDINFSAISRLNRNFAYTYDLYALIKHSIYCNECIPKMLPLVGKNKLDDSFPDAEKVYVCSNCWLVSVGIDAIDENVYKKRSAKTGYQNVCKACSKDHLKELPKNKSLYV